MNQHKKIAILLCTLLIFLSGCWDYISIDNTYYIYSLGIDYQDNNYIVYAQILNLSQLAAPSHAGTLGETDKSWVGVGKGSTILAATTQIQLSLENSVDWGHLNSIIISDQALRHGIREAFELLLHYYKSRLIQWVFATDQPLEDIFQALPIIFQTPYYSLIGSPLNYYQHSSYIRPIRTHRFMQQMHEPGKTVLLPSISIKRRWSGTKEKNITSLTIDGVFPTQNYRSQIKLPFPKTWGLRWLQKDLQNSKLFINNKGNEVAQIECRKPKPKIQAKLVQNKPKFFIQTHPKCTIMSMQIPLRKKEIERLAKHEIEREIRDTYLNGLKQKIDIYSLSNIFFHQHPKQWKKNLTLTPTSIQVIEAKPIIVDTGSKKIKDQSEQGK